MNKNKKLLISALASIALLSSTGVALTSIKPNDVQATKMPNQKYIKRFYKVRITKKTAYYKVIRGRDEAHNKYKKMGYLKPGQIVYVRGRGVVWGWTIGKKYNYCSFRSSFNYSWFTTNLKKNVKKTAKGRNVSKNNTYYIDTTVLSTDEISFLNDPSTPLIAKAQKVLSYSGSKQKAAEYILMEQENLADEKTKKPEVSYSTFEKNLNNFSSKVSGLQSWLD